VTNNILSFIVYYIFIFIYFIVPNY